MDVVAPRITTDRSVDTHSLASIVAVVNEQAEGVIEAVRTAIIQNQPP